MQMKHLGLSRPGLKDLRIVGATHFNLSHIWPQDYGVPLICIGKTQGNGLEPTKPDRAI